MKEAYGIYLMLSYDKGISYFLSHDKWHVLFSLPTYSEAITSKLHLAGKMHHSVGIIEVINPNLEAASSYLTDANWFINQTIITFRNPENCLYSFPRIWQGKGGQRTAYEVPLMKSLAFSGILNIQLHLQLCLR